MLLRKKASPMNPAPLAPPPDLHGALTFERYRPKPGEIPGGYVGWCVRVTIAAAAGIKVSNLLAPEAFNSSTLWLFAAEAAEKALAYLSAFRLEVAQAQVEYVSPTKHCRITHAEGYIHTSTERVAGNKQVNIRLPAIRFVIQIGDNQIIPCADALPELQSVDDWSEGFSEIVADKVRQAGGRVDQSALRAEFAKIARNAIKAMDKRDMPTLALPVLKQ